MEMVDVIDENGNILFKLRKDEAHDKGLLHKTVIAELIDSQGRWTLVKQAPHKQDAGQFVSPMGGHVHSGESEVEALFREVEEELGIKKFHHKFIGKKIFNRKVSTWTENHYFYVYEIYTDDIPVLNDESVEHRKFTKEEIRQLLVNNRKFFGNSFHFLLENLYLNF